MDLRALLEDLARSYTPANAHERMLVTNLAECWDRVERARNAERRFFDGRDVLEAANADLQRYKIITRYVAECERAWRHAIRELERIQRRRTVAGRAPKAAAPVRSRSVDNTIRPVAAPVLPIQTPRRE
jgi:hypothetical protein